MLNRSFARELQNDCLDALIASPVPASALFCGKALANYRAADGGRDRIAAGFQHVLRHPLDEAVLADAAGDAAGNLGDDHDRNCSAR